VQHPPAHVLDDTPGVLAVDQYAATITLSKQVKYDLSRYRPWTTLDV
jgi:hypothetical protein